MCLEFIHDEFKGWFSGSCCFDLKTHLSICWASWLLICMQFCILIYFPSSFEKHPYTWCLGSRQDIFARIRFPLMGHQFPASASYCPPLLFFVERGLSGIRFQRAFSTATWEIKLGNCALEQKSLHRWKLSSRYNPICIREIHCSHKHRINGWWRPYNMCS